MSNLTVENVYTRHKAKELTKRHFWKLLAMGLIVAVIVYAITFGSTLLLNLSVGSTLTTSVVTFDDVEAAYNSDDPSAIVGAALAAANSPSISAGFVIGCILMMLIVTLVNGGLSLGLTSAMIDLSRGKENVTVGRVFSRMKHCLKALGLALWVGLKTLLWALPAYVLTGVGFYLVLTTGNEMLTALLPLCSIILLFALVLPAYYRYMLSTYVLADKPATGIFACVNESKALMKGHKWQAFKLTIPIALALFGLLIAMLLVFALLIALLVDVSAELTVIAALLFFVAVLGLSLYFGFRMSLAYCVFYLKRQGEDDADSPAAEAAPAE